MEDKRNTGAKQRILNAAIELFAEKGYRGTTTREIVKKAGSSLSMLDLHFGSKEGLYKEVVKQVMDVYVMQTVPFFGEIVNERSLNPITKEKAWLYIEKLIDIHLNIISADENRKLIMVLIKALQEQEEIDNNIEPAFMYIYNFQMLFEDYAGVKYGQWWARVLSFQIVTTMFNLLTYPRVINPFDVLDGVLGFEPIDKEVILTEEKKMLLNTIRTTLDDKC